MCHSKPPWSSGGSRTGHGPLPLCSELQSPRAFAFIATRPHCYSDDKCMCVRSNSEYKLTVCLFVYAYVNVYTHSLRECLWVYSKSTAPLRPPKLPFDLGHTSWRMCTDFGIELFHVWLSGQVPGRRPRHDLSLFDNWVCVLCVYCPPSVKFSLFTCVDSLISKAFLFLLIFFTLRELLFLFTHKSTLRIDWHILFEYMGTLWLWKHVLFFIRCSSLTDWNETHNVMLW